MKRTGGRAPAINVGPLPTLLLVAAVLLAMFLLGMYSAGSGSLPSSSLRSIGNRVVGEPQQCAPVTTSVRDEMRGEFGLPMLHCPAATLPSADAAARRIELLDGDSLAEPVLVKGEVGAFLDLCPAPWGCLAVEYSRSGAVGRTWPFLPVEIAAAIRPSDTRHPRERPFGWSFPRKVATFHLSPYPNGDLLVVFHLQDSHPYGGGMARVAQNGRPRWFRNDYSHHQPQVLGEDLMIVPAMRLERRHLRYRIHNAIGSSTAELHCESGMIIEDRINVVNGRGEVVEEVPVLDAILASRFAGSLYGAPDCDPTHLNFVHVLGADAGSAAGIAPGDFVVSLRNISAFGILDKDDGSLKRLVRGGFHRQHAVRHLRQALFVILDNLGTDGEHGPSRLLVVDLASGEEITVFPNDNTPADLRHWLTSSGGHLDISADRSRALLTVAQAGRAFEIRLADGEALNHFRQLHDLSRFPRLPFAERAWYFQFHGLHYAKP